AMKEGSLIGAPIVGVKMTINDGQSHPVDSNDNAFQIAAIGAFREGYAKAKPVILEPIMKVQMTAPTEFQGNLFGLINQRRGVIVDSTDENNSSTVNAEVPLSEMFGFSTILRSSTQGKGEFTMEFEKYGRVPNAIAEELIKKYQDQKKAAK
ncbi:MAG: elongation factor G, partial [Treponema sp.]|nr:elongation factor G [Treponema sp.]